MKETIREGAWLYDESVEKSVFLVKADFDFWYEIGKADGQIEENEREELNEKGVLYYICFQSDPEAEPGWLDSPGYKTEKEAMNWAQSKSPSPIKWT